MSFESAHRPIFDMPESGLINTGQWMPESVTPTDNRTPEEKDADLVFSYQNALDVGDDAIAETCEGMIREHLANNPELNQ